MLYSINTKALLNTIPPSVIIPFDETAYSAIVTILDYNPDTEIYTVKDCLGNEFEVTDMVIDPIPDNILDNKFKVKFNEYHFYDSETIVTVKDIVFHESLDKSDKILYDYFCVDDTGFEQYVLPSDLSPIN